MPREQLLTYRPLPGARLNMSHPLTKGLVGCWLLNENGGYRAMDLSPYGNHGKLVGFDSPPRRPFNGLPFDGTDDRIDGSTILSVPSGFTALAWWKRLGDSGGTTDSGFHLIIGWLNGQTANRIQVLKDGTSFTAVTSIGGVVKTSSMTIPATAWNQLGMTWNGITLYPFLNGLSGTATAATGTLDVGTTPFRIGYHSANVYYANGLIGLVCIWKDRALLPSDIRWLYAEPYDMILR